MAASQREAARGQRPDHVDHGQATVAHRVVHDAELAEAEGLRVVRAVGIDNGKQLPFGGLGQLQLLEHGRHGGDGAVAHGHQLVLGHVAQAALDQIVALQGKIVLGVLGIEQRRVERVVVARDRTHAGADQIAAGHQIGHDLGAAPDLGMRQDGVVAGSTLEVEQGRQHVLGQDLPHPAGHGAGDGRTVDAAVLGALNTHRPLQAQAARLEIEERLALVDAHQQLAAGAGGAARLEAAAGIGRDQEGLRPWRVVAVDEGALGAVDRDRLGVGGEAVQGQAQLLGLLDRALHQRVAAGDRRPHLAADRVQPGIARDPHGGLDLGEAQPHRGRGVGRHLQRVVLGVGDVGLVGGLAPRAQLRLREGQLDRVQPAHHVGELGRGHAGGVADALLARHVDVDQPAREQVAVQRHGLGGDAEVEMVARDERVDQVELDLGSPVQHGDPAVDKHQ